MKTFELIDRLTDLRLHRIENAEDRRIIFEAEAQLGVAASRGKRTRRNETTIIADPVHGRGPHAQGGKP